MIFVVSGSPGAGKTSVSRVLAQCFLRGVHVPVDDLRELVVSGVAHPVPTWTDETARQFRLASEVAAFIAQRYSSEGFVVVIDNVVFPNFDPFVHLEAHRILLRPSLEALLARNAARTNKDFDTDMLESTIRRIHAELEAIPETALEGWLVLDSSRLSLEETVQRILDHFKPELEIDRP
jgi:thymidylate kinase